MAYYRAKNLCDSCKRDIMRLRDDFFSTTYSDIMFQKGAETPKARLK